MVLFVNFFVIDILPQLNRTNLYVYHKKTMVKLIKSRTDFATRVESVLSLIEYADDCKNKCNHQ